MIEGGWQDGLSKARGQRIDLVLAEQNMPDMDGLCLIKVLRTMKNYQNVPIVVLTTESGDAVQALGKVVGPMDGWPGLSPGVLDRSLWEIDWFRTWQINGMAVGYDGAEI